MKKAIIKFIDSEDPLVFFIKVIVVPAAAIGFAVLLFLLFGWANGLI